MIDEIINSPAMVPIVWQLLKKLYPTIVFNSLQYLSNSHNRRSTCLYLDEASTMEVSQSFWKRKVCHNDGWLHIEMAPLRFIGDWFDGSEWVELLSNFILD